MTTTAQGDDYQWVNRETASAAEAIYELLSLHKLVTEMLHRSSNGGSFADNLEGLLWLLWEGKPKRFGQEASKHSWSSIDTLLGNGFVRGPDASSAMLAKVTRGIATLLVDMDVLRQFYKKLRFGN